MEKLARPSKPYQAPPDPRHVDVLDGVRVLCVFLVAWFHIWQQGWLSPSIRGEAGAGFLADLLLRLGWLSPGQTLSLDFLLRSGYIWVDGLILLSGFLLYLPYAEAGDRLPSAGAFYKRRLFRILPSYLLCVIPLFILACVRGRYASGPDAAKDLFAHLTFTFNLFPATYFGTPINGALWTLAVEMQFYLLFPFLARGFRRFPVLTYCLMAGGAFAFRFFAARQADTSMYFNQLPAFLDVYANGMAAAGVFAALRKKLGAQIDGRIKLFFTVMISCRRSEGMQMLLAWQPLHAELTMISTLMSSPLTARTMPSRQMLLSSLFIFVRFFLPAHPALRFACTGLPSSCPCGAVQGIIFHNMKGYR